MEYQRRGEQIINPGPEIPELLRLQDVHRSEKTWKDKGGNEYIKVQRSYDFKYDDFDERVKAKLHLAGFDAIARLSEGKLDLHLVTALVERWRPETHTFHLPVGEATITLQDVEIMTGLPVDGMPVTYQILGVDWFELCYELLGEKPKEEDLRGKQLRHKWLDTLISKSIPENAIDYVVECRTRAVILRMFGGLIFNNKSGNRVCLTPLLLLRNLEMCKQYAWGAAMLSFLYREMCLVTNPVTSQMGGFVGLLQCWAYERIPIITPTIRSNFNIEDGLPYALKWKFSRDGRKVPLHNVSAFRDALDGQRDNEFIWQPYNAILPLLHPRYRRGETVWRAEVPLIFFHLVEYHQVDRCLRQFGMDQHIPHEPQNLDKLHREDMRGNGHVNWCSRHSSFIQFWEDRYNRVWMRDPLERPLTRQSMYMQWYVRRTRRWMTDKGARVSAAADGIQRVYHMEPDEGSWNTMRGICGSILGGFEDEERLAGTYESQPAGPSQPMPPMPEPNTEGQRRRKSFRERRRQISPVGSPQGISQVPPQMCFDLYSQHVEQTIPQNQNAPNMCDIDDFPTYSTHQSTQQPEYYYPSIQFDTSSQMQERSEVPSFFTPMHTSAPAFGVHDSTNEVHQRDMAGSSSNVVRSPATIARESFDEFARSLFDGGSPEMYGNLLPYQGASYHYQSQRIQDDSNSEDVQMGGHHQPLHNRREPSQRIRNRTRCYTGSHLIGSDEDEDDA